MPVFHRETMRKNLVELLGAERASRVHVPLTDADKTDIRAAIAARERVLCLEVETKGLPSVILDQRMLVCKSIYPQHIEAMESCTKTTEGEHNRRSCVAKQAGFVAFANTQIPGVQTGLGGTVQLICAALYPMDR
jgi:hypothetical protein